MLFEKIRNLLLANEKIAQKCGERIFYLQPLRAQTAPFVIFKRQNFRDKNGVQTDEQIEITVFCESATDLLELSAEVKNVILNFPRGENYFNAVFVAGNDGTARLGNGFLFCDLVFVLQKS